jgi:hypothetical protein
MFPTYFLEKYCNCNWGQLGKTALHDAFSFEPSYWLLSLSTIVLSSETTKAQHLTIGAQLSPPPTRSGPNLDLTPGSFFRSFVLRDGA